MKSSIQEVTPKTPQADVVEAIKTVTPNAEQAKPEAWKAFAKEMHNYAQLFDSARYGRGDYFDDTVQITTNDALNMYGRTAIIAPIAGVATLLTGAAVAASGLLRFIASPVLPDQYMGEASVRMAEGTKMVAKGAALVVAGPLSLLTTPLAVLTQKATGFDAFKSFSKAMGYREVNAKNPLNNTNPQQDVECSDLTLKFGDLNLVVGDSKLANKLESAVVTALADKIKATESYKETREAELAAKANGRSPT